MAGNDTGAGRLLKVIEGDQALYDAMPQAAKNCASGMPASSRTRLPGRAPTMNSGARPDARTLLDRGLYFLAAGLVVQSVLMND